MRLTTYKQMKLSFMWMGEVNVLPCYDYMTKLFVIFALLSGRNCEVDEINKPCFVSYIVLLQVLCCADNWVNHGAVPHHIHRSVSQRLLSEVGSVVDVHNRLDLSAALIKHRLLTFYVFKLIVKYSIHVREKSKTPPSLLLSLNVWNLFLRKMFRIRKSVKLIQS